MTTPTSSAPPVIQPSRYDQFVDAGKKLLGRVKTALHQEVLDNKFVKEAASALKNGCFALIGVCAKGGSAVAGPIASVCRKAGEYTSAKIECAKNFFNSYRIGRVEKAADKAVKELLTAVVKAKHLTTDERITVLRGLYRGLGDINDAVKSAKRDGTITAEERRQIKQLGKNIVKYVQESKLEIEKAALEAKAEQLKKAEVDDATAAATAGIKARQKGGFSGIGGWVQRKMDEYRFDKLEHLRSKALADIVKDVVSAKGLTRELKLELFGELTKKLESLKSSVDKAIFDARKDYLLTPEEFATIEARLHELKQFRKKVGVAVADTRRTGKAPTL